MFVNALKLFSWEGRICRRQYLLAFALITICLVVLLGGLISASDGSNESGLAQVLMILGQLALIPTQIKRLHDIGWSGWIILLAQIPFLNMIIGLGLFLFSGTKGPNKYGEDPHASK